MLTWIKQLLCRHDFRKAGNRQHMRHKGFIELKTVYRCTKCGKEVLR